MVFDKNVFFFVSLQPSKIAFLLLSIYSISHFLAVRVSLQKKKKWSLHHFCPPSTKPAHFLRLFFIHLLAAALTMPTPPQKKRNRQPAHPSKPAAACPASRPKTPSSTELYYLYTIFCSYSAKSFQRFRVNTYNLFDLSF